MSNDVAVRETEIITRDKVLEYLKVFTPGSLNDKEQSQFIEIATAYNLNPFKREIYCVPYMSNVKKPDGSWTKERKLSIITGYEVYLKRAERTGLLNGWTVSTRKENGDTIAKITIHRKNWQHPFEHEIYFSEYKEENKMWKEKPMTMLKKVAMAQGFRLAFPDEMGGMPYSAEELPDNMTNVTPEDKKPAQKPEPKPEAKHTPDVLKNDKGEIELQPGDQAAALKKISECKRSEHVDSFLLLREQRTWTEEQKKEQDAAIAALNIKLNFRGEDVK